MKAEGRKRRETREELMASADQLCSTAYTGWAKFMQWKYPVEVVVTSPKTFKAAGAVEAAASL